MMLITFEINQNPTSHNKAHTGDLSRFVAVKKAAHGLDQYLPMCCLFSISISPTLRKTAGRKPKPDEHTSR